MAASGVSVSSLWQWMDVQTVLLFSVLLLLLTDFVRSRRPQQFPPGPWALPLVGNMFSMDFKKAHESLTQLAKQHGSVYSLRMGQSWTVVINTFTLVKEALVTHGDSMADRPETAIDVDISHKFGVVSSNGHLWKQQRKFALFTLKYFGVGKKTLETAILEEFEYLANELDEMKGKPFDPNMLTSNAVSNIICLLVFGRRFEYTDQNFQRLMQLFEINMNIEASIWAELYNAFPFVMRRLPGPHQTLKANWEKVFEFIRSEIAEHRKEWDPAEPRDYIDCYLTEIQKNKDEAAGFHEENLVVSVMDLFVAGSETTSTTLRWSFLYLAKYSEVQEKIQAEIDSVIGQSRQPNMADRPDMPYTDAALHEIQRMGNIAPLGLPRMTTKDIQLGEYLIPKGTRIVANLTSVLFDKNEWDTPNTFNPGHFLNAEGKFVKKAAFMPFSAGKRVCLGENLARMELFLFFTSFLQRFSFSMPAGVKPVMDYRFGITLAPLPHEICAIPRNL